MTDAPQAWAGYAGVRGAVEFVKLNGPITVPGTVSMGMPNLCAFGMQMTLGHGPRGEAGYRFHHFRRQAGRFGRQRSVDVLIKVGPLFLVPACGHFRSRTTVPGRAGLRPCGDRPGLAPGGSTFRVVPS
jgi:hypothetical protein